MKAYKIELLVIDFDNVGKDGIINNIENARYANHCISPVVKKITEKDIGEWNDNHPLNTYNTSNSEYDRLFKNI